MSFRDLFVHTVLLGLSLSSYGQEVFNTVKYERQIPRVAVLKPDPIKWTNPSNLAQDDSSQVQKGKPQAGSLLLKIIVITSAYGKRKDPFSGKLKKHRGIDLRAKQDSVHSILPGIVSKVYYHKKLGISVEIKHGRFTSVYGHLSHTYVTKGRRVMEGQLIALSGNTGRSKGPHLHFSLKNRGKVVNPLPFLLEIKKLRES